MALMSRINRPFPSSKHSYFLNATENDFLCMHDNKKSFRINGFTFSFALKQKLNVPRKQSIMNKLDTGLSQARQPIS